MQNERSSDKLEDLADLAARAEEHLSALGNSSHATSEDLLEERAIIYTPGNSVELAISKTQRMKCSLEFIRLGRSELLLSVLLFPENKYASPTPITIDKSSIVGWYGDSDAIHLILPSIHEMVTISKTQDRAKAHVNKIEDIVEALRMHKIKFIDKNHRPGAESEKLIGQVKTQKSDKLGDRGKDLRTSNQSTHLFQNIQAGIPARLWSKVQWGYLQGIVIGLFGVSIVYAIHGEGWGLVFSTLVTSVIALCCLPAWKVKTRQQTQALFARTMKSSRGVEINIPAYFFVLTYVFSFFIALSSSKSGGRLNFHSVTLTLLFALIAPLAYWFSSNRHWVTRLSLAICRPAAVIASVILFYTGAVGSAIMQNSMGISYAHERDFKDSLKAYSIAISINPLNATYATNRGWAYYYLGDKKSAAKDVNRALKISPKDKRALQLLRQLKS
jgi:hypothetical protein